MYLYSLWAAGCTCGVQWNKTSTTFAAKKGFLKKLKLQPKIRIFWHKFSAEYCNSTSGTCLKMSYSKPRTVLDEKYGTVAKI